MGSPTTYLSIMISRSAIYLYYYKVEPLVPRVPLKRWSVTHSVIVNTTTCCYAYVIKKIRTRKYGKPLIQKTQIWETFDTESIGLLLTQELYDTLYDIGLPSYGSRFLAWHVLQTCTVFFPQSVHVSQCQNPSLCFR